MKRYLFFSKQSDQVWSYIKRKNMSWCIFLSRWQIIIGRFSNSWSVLLAMISFEQIIHKRENWRWKANIKVIVYDDHSCKKNLLIWNADCFYMFCTFQLIWMFIRANTWSQTDESFMIQAQVYQHLRLWNLFSKSWVHFLNRRVSIQIQIHKQNFQSLKMSISLRSESLRMTTMKIQSDSKCLQKSVVDETCMID